ncbi:MAG: SDR family NAD(P)-dependent oxidoreductase [Rhodobacteraceae bacterium]|nr:SDR family NAD(P)-dependent oxidoreductase [Paracoccaceae bacterium]
MGQTIKTSGFSNWKPSQLPDLAGKTYVITGANSGIGYEAARMLGERGGDIIMVCRSRAKAETAQAKLLENVKGSVKFILMDLSDLSSVRKAAEELRGGVTRIDALINNAGVMMTPQEKTVDGFDLQMGANHLGHFLWTGLLIDLVEAAAGRVVALSSIAHKSKALNLDDLMTEEGYTPTKAYTQSKLANLMFVFELDRRLSASGSKAIAIACHPGYTDTNLQSTGPAGFMKFGLAVLNKFGAQRPEAGAIPTVLATAGKEAQRGAYYGPTGIMEVRGPVSDAKVAAHALDREKQAKLWEMSETLVGHTWGLAPSEEAA